jgi:hypothetical protein
MCEQQVKQAVKFGKSEIWAEGEALQP